MKENTISELFCQNYFQIKNATAFFSAGISINPNLIERINRRFNAANRRLFAQKLQ